MEQTEIIDIRDERDLLRTWEPFICRDHVDLRRDFYETILARFPRRSCEVMFDMMVDLNVHHDRPMPRMGDWEALERWYGPLVKEELLIDMDAA